MQQQLGRSPRFVEGRRVTEAADLEVLEMVLCGVINKALSRDLTGAGRRAVGIAATDAELVTCDLVPELGRVGRPLRVHSVALVSLLDAGLTPVIAPVALGPDGAPVNLNADECAAAIAQALKSPRLLLLSDVEGVRVESEWRGEVAGADIESLIASGEVTGGMIVKLRAAAAATRGGVGEVRIAGFHEEFEKIGGTRVHTRSGGALHA
jgi:acetylglutamate kinase